MRRALRICVVFVLGISAAALAFAQSAGRIEGTLTGPDGKPLPGVEVSVVETGAKATTDAAGGFAIGDLPAGVYTVLYNYDQLAETEPPVTVTAGATTRLERKLDWDLAFQESITVVSASRTEERITEAPAA